MRAPLIAILTVALYLAPATAEAAQTHTSSNLSYDELLSLDPSERRVRLAQMSPDRIAALKRTHADRWFALHGDQLSNAQVAVFVEAREFIAGSGAPHSNDAETRDREAVLTRKLTCVLGAENTRQAFVLHLVEEQASAGWRSAADEWLSWFFECVVP